MSQRRLKRPERRMKTSLAARLLPLLFGTALLSGCLLPPGSNAQTGPWVDPLLQNHWHFYKTRHMANNERVISQNYGGTITEGQSYALAKALYHNDPDTFERVIRWTTANMKRPNDNLFGWRWGQRSNGTWGLIETENATDADQDIAYYLLEAAEKWNRADYANQARAIIADVWRLNVVQVQGKYYINPGTWEGFRFNNMLTVNPSYFGKWMYRKFAQVDTARPWNQLADNIYPTLEACSDLTSTKLPPNWCGVRFDNGQIVFSDVQGPGSRDFTWDAHRVFWRAGVDATQGDARALNYLKTRTYLINYFNQNNRIPEGFTWDGQPRNNPNSAFTLSMAVSQYYYINPGDIQNFYNRSLGPLYNNQGYWQDPSNDFMQSVVWFGLRNLKYPTSGGSTTPPPPSGGGTTTPPPPPPPSDCQPAPSTGGGSTSVAAPTNLVASNQQPSSWQKLVRLDWRDNATNETAYVVERSTSSATAGFEQVAQIGANSTAWAQFVPFTRSFNLYYRVIAIGPSGERSVASNTVTVAPF